MSLLSCSSTSFLRRASSARDLTVINLVRIGGSVSWPLGSLVTARRSRMNILSPGPHGQKPLKVIYVYLLLRVERSDVNQITEALTQTPNHWLISKIFGKLDTKNFGTNDKKLLIVTRDRDWQRRQRPGTSQHHCHCTEHSTQYRGSWPHLPVRRPRLGQTETQSLQIKDHQRHSSCYDNLGLLYDSNMI